MLIKSNNQDISWLLRAQMLLVVLGSLLFGLLGKEFFYPFLIGALLVTFNFFILARKLPELIKMQKGSVFSLLVNFYFRLLFTAIVLFVCIALLRFSVFPLLIGLSTVVITVMLWAFKFIIFGYYKQKEA